LGSSGHNALDDRRPRIDSDLYRDQSGKTHDIRIEPCETSSAPGMSFDSSEAASSSAEETEETEEAEEKEKLEEEEEKRCADQRRTAPTEAIITCFIKPAEASGSASNVKVLAITATLFMVITSAQVFAARAANSAELMADCISMGVDAGTYFLNMLVELCKGTLSHRPLQLTVPVLSISVLVYFIIDAMRESLATLRGAPSDEEDVNPWIVFAFALWGIIFDVISLYAFRRNQKKGADGKSINMMTALMHVGADLARSVTTLILSLLIFAGFDSAKADAWASLVVCVIILLGAACMVCEWVMEIRKSIHGQLGPAPC